MTKELLHFNLYFIGWFLIIIRLTTPEFPYILSLLGVLIIAVYAGKGLASLFK